MSRRMPLCLVVTFQPDALYRRHPAMPFAQALSATADVEWISLAALTREETAGLCEAQLGEAPPSSQLSALVEGSGGVPLAIEQLALDRTLWRYWVIRAASASDGRGCPSGGIDPPST